MAGINFVNVELCDKDRALLERIAEALESIKPQTPTEPAAPEFLSKKMNVPEKPAAQEEVKPDQPPQPESAPTVTLDQLRELAQAMLAPGSSKKDAVRALITGYARKLSDIPADKWPEVYAKLTDLKEGRA